MTKPPIRRCAVYTRKSSDEGLDQAFNSLDAQREAGEAYVKSQASEGWRVSSRRYDDGGFSGGSMERPGLKQLLADVDAGVVDVIVVYKIDRLTRSLADFARIVERFDARGVSFVSVTQPFNTTSSMGRLTLNVLLSFAQFEREVTGERIRDKIAASKAKGMWMGGAPPLGYDLPAAGTHKLVVNPAEAETVRHIFERYLALRSVHRLQCELAREGVVSKRRVTRAGKILGGGLIGRGQLFHLLRNRTYLGQIVHKAAVYPGEHDGIVDETLFERVQASLQTGGRRGERRVAGAMLTGRIVDSAGAAMSPAFSYGRSKRVYRYYVTASIQQGIAVKRDDAIRRISAPAIEALVKNATERLHPSGGMDALRQVQLGRGRIALTLPASIRFEVQERLAAGEELIKGSKADTIVVTLPAAMPKRGGACSVVMGQTDAAAPDPILINALRKAHAMLQREQGLPTIAAAPPSPYDRRLLRLAFLAPELQRDILAGHQPRQLTLEKLMHQDIPLDWRQQRSALSRG